MTLLRAKMLFFDVGETLVSERRMWASWAKWLEVPEPEFFAALGAVIEARKHHRQVFGYFKRDFDTERAARVAAGDLTGFHESDMFADVIPALQWARDNGFRLGFAGNHSEETEIALKRFGIDAEIAGSSARWGVEKPDRRFFDRIVGLSGLAPSEICYVGDRLDNDVMGATRAGLGAVWLQRGLWATVQSRWPEAAAVRDKIASLNELEGLFSDA